MGGRGRGVVILTDETSSLSTDLPETLRTRLFTTNLNYASRVELNGRLNRFYVEHQLE